jgi:hypothetical protein
MFTYKKVYPFFVSGPLGTITFVVAIAPTVGRVTKRQEVEYVHRSMATILDVAIPPHCF